MIIIGGGTISDELNYCYDGWIGNPTQDMRCRPFSRRHSIIIIINTYIPIFPIPMEGKKIILHN